MKRIILTGGGTAGHISPILALIDILKKNARLKYLYVGSRSGPEREIAKRDKLNFYGIFAGKRRNYASFSNFIDFFKIFFGLIQSYFLLKSFRPEIIFAKGGYVTVPILYWAKRFKIPIVIHESDVTIGRTNLWASTFAKKICLGFPLHYYRENLPREKLVYTGIPIKRDFFAQTPTKNLRPVILATGGSQGSNKINELFRQIAADLNDYEVYHLTGPKEFNELKEKLENEFYHVIAFSDEMPQMINRADIIISRAGASTIAEIAALGKPAILIPFPNAYLNHQAANAKILTDKNAAVVISEKNLTASSLLSIIKRLAEDDEFRRLLGHHIREFAAPNAASEIVDILFEVVERHHE